MIVVDVNVITYLLLEGARTAAAEAVFALDPEWAAPPLWRSEWRNVLTGYMRRGVIDERTAIDHAQHAAELIGDREHRVSDARVFDLVSRSRCTAYDCEYVALAELLEIPLVTADQRILLDFPHVARSLEDFTG